MKRLVIAFAPLLVVVLAACGSDTSSGTSLVATAAPAQSAPASAKPAASSGAAAPASAAASAPSSAAAKPAASSAAPAAAAKPSGPSTFKVGDVIKDGDLQVTVTKVDAPFKTTNEFEKPEKGQFLVASVSMENTGSKPATVSSMLSFELRDSDGQSYNETIVSNAPKPPDGTIAPGDKLAGGLTFDVPTGKSYRLYFKDSLFSSGQAIIDLGAH